MLTPSQLRESVTSPLETIKELDKYIIGQTEAKKSLSILLFNRSLVLLNRLGFLKRDFYIEKSNVLLVGPTGTGKTSMVRALSEVSGCPITISDITSVTSAGYIGSKVEDILIQYVKNTVEYYDKYYREIYRRIPEMVFLEREKVCQAVLEVGIIYIDEFDKIRSGGRNDVSGDLVQNELLKFFEGAEVSMTDHSSSSRNKAQDLPVQAINTKDLFFIAGGAFKGLEEIVMKRINKGAGIGFSSELPKAITDKDKDNYLKHLTTEDLVEYGFKPELVGRIPLRACLSPMTVDMLKKIMVQPKNSVLSQYQGMFELFGVDLTIEEDAMDEIAELAMELGIGARSLKNIFFDVLSEHVVGIYNQTEEKLVITKSLVQERLNHFRGKK